MIFSINTCFDDRFPDFEADLLPPSGPSTQLLIRHRLFPHHIVRHRCFLLTLYCFPLVYGRCQPLFVGRDPHRSRRQSRRCRLANQGLPPAFLLFSTSYALVERPLSMSISAPASRSVRRHRHRHRAAGPRRDPSGVSASTQPLTRVDQSVNAILPLFFSNSKRQIVY